MAMSWEPDPNIPGLTPWTFWAKWSGVNGSGTSWHPLMCHLMDVAASAEVMWDRVLPLAWTRRLADAMGLDLAATRMWVIFLAGLHDLGKASPGFQLQLPLPEVQRRLEEAGFSAKPTEWVAHGNVSAQALKGILTSHFHVAPDVALAAATAVGGHHGILPSAETLHKLKGTAPYGTSPRWASARLAYARWLAKVLDVGGTPPQRLGHPGAIMLAGFVSVVDWVGSSEYFDHEVKTPDGTMARDLPGYLEHARTQAQLALEHQGWLGWKSPDTSATFKEMFQAIEEPRALQQAVIELAPQFTGPGVVVIEAPMGEGKTEAAEYLADAWNVRLGQQGIYFALPTQATSNQMFGRVRDFLSVRYPRDLVNLQLAHGHAALSEEAGELRSRGAHMLIPSSVQDDEDGHPTEGAVIAAEWFASGKRALLAPFGVGTVDQALLAALQVMHVFVRLYGLSTKTLIVDEVHAYDTYMSTLLQRLMEWLGALGVPVILLSATLPNERRQRLLDSYATGAGWSSSATFEPVTYPRVSWASAGGQGARHITATSKKATVRLQWLDAPGDLDATARRLCELLRDGGCAAVVCNTVARAQQMYDALLPYFPEIASDGNPCLSLFHARFPSEERAKREDEAIARFGKDVTHRPGKAVIVATQVMEQSLDLDFDVMVSDLAPVDLLLQRVGRVHRHARTGDVSATAKDTEGRLPRPPQLRTPCLLIAGPAEISPEDVPTFEHGSARVYEPHILLRSWLLLRQRKTVSIPEDVASLIEETYGERSCPTALSEPLRARWSATAAKMEANRRADEDQARTRYIMHPTAEVDLGEIAPVPRKEDAPELHPAHQALTRLTELNVQVVCLSGSEGSPVLPKGTSVPLGKKPDQAMTRSLLMRTLSITSPGVARKLLEREVPTGWQKSPALRQCRPLVFDAAGSCYVGDYTLRLDSKRGLLIEKTLLAE